MENFFGLCSVLSLPLALMLGGGGRGVAADGKASVLMWSNDESFSFPNTFAGHSVSQAQFKDLYLDKLLADKDIKTLAVFVQDQLSVGEISMRADVYANGDGGAFKHVKDLMSSLPSAFLSKVASPAAALRNLKDLFPGKTYTLKHPYDLTPLHMESADKNLVIVHLPSEHGKGAAVDGRLHSVDDILNNVTLQLQSRSEHFAALYTGEKGREQTPFGQHSGRHLLEENMQKENITGLFKEIPGLFMIYSSKISFVYNYGANSSELSLSDSDWTVEHNAADCPPPGFNETSNVTCALTLNYQHPIPMDDYQLLNFSLNFEFATTHGSMSGYWYLSAFAMSYKNESAPEGNFFTIGLDQKFIDWTPFGFSYHCHENPPIRPNKNESEFNPDSVYLTFKAFQVQAFVVHGNFGYYNDCVGFFTIPIWSAIICSAVLLAILFFGVIMLMSIKTMDRLDDPKGKTISVTIGD